MPYISKERQAEIDPKILEMIQSIGLIKNSGELNYIFTQIAIGALHPQYQYEDLNRIMGVFSCAQSEYYRRMVVPYEETKRIENGDVYPEQEITKPNNNSEQLPPA